MCITNNILIPAIATITATLITATITIILGIFNAKKNEYKALNDQLIQIHSYVIDYPYFEDDAYTLKFSKIKKFTEKEIRYQAFCIFVFNFLEHLCQYYKYDLKKVSQFVHYRELIHQHAGWWSHNETFRDNLEGYEKSFIDLVHKVIKEGTK